MLYYSFNKAARLKKIVNLIFFLSFLGKFFLIFRSLRLSVIDSAVAQHSHDLEIVGLNPSCRLDLKAIVRTWLRKGVKAAGCKKRFNRFSGQRKNLSHSSLSKIFNGYSLQSWKTVFDAELDNCIFICCWLPPAWLSFDWDVSRGCHFLQQSSFVADFVDNSARWLSRQRRLVIWNRLFHWHPIKSDKY